MPRYPYSVRPKSSENANNPQKAKSTGILLRSPQIAENNIENGLRQKLNSLKENNSSVLGLLGQRLSNVEKELRTIKDQLREANRLLVEKDDEIRRLKAQIEGDVTKQDSPEKRKISKTPSNHSGSEENFDRVRGSIDSSQKKKDSPDLVVLRPGEVKPEFKKVKNGEIFDIESPYENIERPPKAKSPSESSRISELEKENKHLSQKVAELEKFIGEYGLMWVGDDALDSISQPDGELHIKSKTTVRVKKPNLDHVITVITDLNQNVSEQNIVKSPLGAKFKRCDILELKLFSDGMQLETNPFRKYDTPSAEAFFKDLEDGYFPSELKSKHPQGVIFKVVDKRNVTYREAMEGEKPQPFSGKGVRLGGKETPEATKGSQSPQKREEKPQSPSVGAPEATKGSRSPQKREEKPLIPSIGAPEVTRSPQKAEERSASPKTNAVPKKKVQKRFVIPDSSYKSGLQEHWINNTSPLPSRARVDQKSDRPPAIEKPSVPLEINLVPPTPTAATVPTKNQEPSKTDVYSPPRYQETSTDASTTGASPKRVFSDQAVYQRAPINITNITYHEAPVTFQLSPEEASTLPSAKGAGCAAPSCRCPRSQKTPRSANEICPGTCGQIGVSGVPKKVVMCPCGCGAQADLHVHREHQIPDKLRHLDATRFEGRTEYEQNYSKTALHRMKLAGYKDEEPAERAEPAGKPSGFAHIDPNEEFEHFTYMGHPKGQKPQEKQSISYRPKIVELNKKISETMMSIRLRSDKNNKTYLIHLYPNEPIEKIWSILNLKGEEYELVGKVGNKPVILLDKMSPAEQNVRNFDVVTLRKSPPSKSSATGMWSQTGSPTSNKSMGSPRKSIASPKLEKSAEKVASSSSIKQKSQNGSPTSGKSVPNVGSPSGKSNVGSPTSGKSVLSPKSPEKLVPVPSSIEQKPKIGSPTSGKSVLSPKSPEKLVPVPSSIEQKPKISSPNISPAKEPSKSLLPPLKVPSSDMTLPNFSAKSPLREKVQEIIEDKYEQFLKKKSKSPGEGLKEILDEDATLDLARKLSRKSVNFPAEPKPAEINASIKARGSHAENRLSAQIPSRGSVQKDNAEEKSPSPRQRIGSEQRKASVSAF